MCTGIPACYCADDRRSAATQHSGRHLDARQAAQGLVRDHVF